MHSTDISDTEEYMNFSKECCIGCITAYTYGDYVYFKNMTYITNENHNNSILNQIHDMYITSPLKFMDKIFELLTNLFVDKMLKNR